jgi:hypothetical protein
LFASSVLAERLADARDVRLHEVVLSSLERDLSGLVDGDLATDLAEDLSLALDDIVVARSRDRRRPLDQVVGLRERGVISEGLARGRRVRSPMT